MSITDSDSVLILGAGVSAPFGLSLGGDLIGKIYKQIDSEIADKYIGAYLQNQIISVSTFGYYPVLSSLLASGLNLETSFERARLLSATLKSSTHDTIDDFIVDHESQSEIAKIALAAILFMQIYVKSDLDKSMGHRIGEKTYYKYRNFRLKILTSRFLVKNRNWVHHLINIVRNKARNFDSFEKVNIITFNYDSVLEYILEEQFDQTERAYGHYSEYFNIIHMHGHFGKFEEAADPTILVPSWAKSICVVQQGDVPKFVAKQRAEAGKVIAAAEKVYSVGFAFSGANCRLIGLDKLFETGGQLYYCNYNGNMGITQAVARMFGPVKSKGAVLRRADIYPAEGTPEKPVSVEDWFASGFAGETPA